MPYSTDNCSNIISPFDISIVYEINIKSELMTCGKFFFDSFVVSHVNIATEVAYVGRIPVYSVSCAPLSCFIYEPIACEQYKFCKCPGKPKLPQEII